MSIINRPITGQETRPDTTSPYSALIDFYYAFNNQRGELIADNWLQTAEASMANPLGDIKRGWTEINGVYQAIFNGPATVYVEFYNYEIVTSRNMFIAVGREKGTFTVGNQTVNLAIRTSRTYCLHNNLWRQVHHHGSIDNPDLLSTYQKTLLNK